MIRVEPNAFYSLALVQVSPIVAELPRDLPEAKIKTSDQSFSPTKRPSPTEQDKTISPQFAKRSQTNAAPAAAVESKHNVTDKVIDQESGDPIPGVNVMVKGTQQGAVTDVEGNYQIKLNVTKGDHCLQLHWLRC